MDFKEYQILAERTINKALTSEEKIAHGMHGMWAEFGEVNSIFQKKLQGHPIVTDELVKELGDLYWMLAELLTVSGNDPGAFNIANGYFGTDTDESLNYLAGDLLQLFTGWVQSRKLHTYNIKSALMNVTNVCNSLDIDYRDVLETNIAKLRKRYPNGFEVDKSVNRTE